MRVAIIIARGGSKRIPRKNVKPFAGQPMILYPIRVALKTPLFDEVFVSTDDDEIAAISMKAGAMVPFKRPASLADDHATTLQVMGHAVRYLLEHDAPLEAACCIYPCTPFLEREELEAGYREMVAKAKAYALPVLKYSPAVQRALVLDEANTVKMGAPEHQSTRTQDLQPRWYDAGRWYWGTRAAWSTEASIFEGLAVAIPSDRDHGIDIDTPEDWELAETLYRMREAAP